MRRVELLRWIWQLEDMFGEARPAIDPAPLLERYQAQDYAGMVSLIAKSMNLDAWLRIGYVKSGGPAGAPVWVRLPVPMPSYGSPTFKSTRFTIFVRKETLKDYSFELLVSVFAHELSHILLHSTGHVARHDEEATDLAAMLFGYGRYFIVQTEDATERAGYLSEEEIAFARAFLGT